MLFCKHDWKLLDKTTLPSKMEILWTGTVSLKGEAFAIDFNELCKQKTIITFTCTKCGKLKIVTESN